MNAVELLARLGWQWTLEHYPPPDDADPDNDAACMEAHARHVARVLCDTLVEGANEDYCRWVVRTTWPVRVPALVTWSGQVTLPKIIKKLQGMLRQASSPFAEVPAKGTTGLDALTCQRTLDIGWSPNELGVAIYQRPMIELLAIIAAEATPVISQAYEDGERRVGVLWEDDFGEYRPYYWRVTQRDGRYLYRWGEIDNLSGEDLSRLPRCPVMSSGRR